MGLNLGILTTMKRKPLVLIIAVAATFGVVSCKEKESTPVGEFKEAVDDGLDRRPNEKLKDAGEDARDAVKDAAKDVKDADQ